MPEFDQTDGFKSLIGDKDSVSPNRINPPAAGDTAKKINRKLVSQFNTMVAEAENVQ